MTTMLDLTRFCISGYVYNADNDDEGGEGYGLAPPALGYYNLLESITRRSRLNFDNNRNGLDVDET